MPSGFGPMGSAFSGDVPGSGGSTNVNEPIITLSQKDYYKILADRDNYQELAEHWRKQCRILSNTLERQNDLIAYYKKVVEEKDARDNL
ncbi:MAG TPA: hypothetical protein VN843_34455 [Anaerolineales bacterium]|nr:hypothetical protein [Anaerolineales bacterium]